MVIGPLSAGSMGMMVNCAREEACNLQSVYTQQQQGRRGLGAGGVQVSEV